MPMTPELRQNIEAFEAQQASLEKHHMGKFVVFHDSKLIGAFDTFDAAAREAVQRFGAGPYLIRQVGGPTRMPMPASVAYRPVSHAAS